MQVDVSRLVFAGFPFESHTISMSFRVTGKHFNGNTWGESFLNFAHDNELVTDEVSLVNVALNVFKDVSALHVASG